MVSKNRDILLGFGVDKSMSILLKIHQLSMKYLELGFLSVKLDSLWVLCLDLRVSDERKTKKRK